VGSPRLPYLIFPNLYDRLMRRVLPWALAAAVVVAAGALAIHHYVKGPLAPIVGTWSGSLIATSGNHASPQHFVTFVDRSEKAGWWRTGPHCGGPLRLKDISYGFHHYYRLGITGGCVAPGIDCFRRDGARMMDVFVSNSGKENSSGEFRRAA
jgi:hypothetical protein